MNSQVNRIRRLRGQLTHVEKAIEGGLSCHDVVPQLLAAKGALDGVVRVYLSDALSSCDGATELREMQQLLKLLIKNI
ncbi:metal-sensing transcriptional repressor [Patescibacteria group bacterium]|nr:metal-sensing transcriptional repressor [Patescibacteria group bacterium]